MSVENVKVKFIRPKGYCNLKEWIDDSKNVYIGRAGIVFIDKQRYPKSNSPFCNPYKINRDGTREEVIEKYGVYITNKIKERPELVQKLLDMKDKTLGCWCYPELCHGNVLLELINVYSSM